MNVFHLLSVSFPFQLRMSSATVFESFPKSIDLIRLSIIQKAILAFSFCFSKYPRILLDCVGSNCFPETLFLHFGNRLHDVKLQLKPVLHHGTCRQKQHDVFLNMVENQTKLVWPHLKTFSIVKKSYWKWWKEQKEDADRRSVGRDYEVKQARWKRSW